MKYSELQIIFEKFLITDGKKLRLRQKNTNITVKPHSKVEIKSRGSGSSRAREFHPHPLTEPCVKVSPHTALHTQLFVHRHFLIRSRLRL